MLSLNATSGKHKRDSFDHSYTCSIFAAYNLLSWQGLTHLLMPQMLCGSIVADATDLYAIIWKPVPEPATLALLLAGGLTLLKRKRLRERGIDLRAIRCCILKT